MRRSQKKAFEMFIDFKNKFLALNRLLTAKLFEKKKIEKVLEEKKVKVKEDKKKKEESLLNKKYEEFEQKLKTKKKLTTNDLLGGK
jgi:uncharacterized coiled-coil DUF342 family protein